MVLLAMGMKPSPLSSPSTMTGTSGGGRQIPSGRSTPIGSVSCLGPFSRPGSVFRPGLVSYLTSVSPPGLGLIPPKVHAIVGGGDGGEGLIPLTNSSQGIRFLLALVIRRLTTHPFRDGAPFLPLIETPPTFGRSLSVFHILHRNFLLILFPSRFTDYGHHLSPRINSSQGGGLCHHLRFRVASSRTGWG